MPKISCKGLNPSHFPHTGSPFRVFPLLLGLAVLEAPAQATVQGEPFGYVKINITAGTGNSKRVTLLSIPLLEEASITGRTTGWITGVTSNTITASGATWRSISMD